jgi:2-haloacid dehalogenase
VVFDIGNVLIQWDPRHLYRRLLADEADCDRFLAEVCTAAWNLEQDRGRPWAEAIAERIALFPGQADLIRAYSERWHEMVPGEVPGTVALLEQLRAAGVPLYAITNFSCEKFAEAQARFPVLTRFIDVVVSGEVRLVKPDPAIYRLLLERNRLDAAGCLFIDDSAANVRAAEALGMQAHHFRDAAGLAAALRAAGLPV